MAKETPLKEGLPVRAPVDDVAVDGDRPNILLICTDQQRFDWLGAMGHPLVQTPQLDTLAAQGTLFSSTVITILATNTTWPTIRGTPRSASTSKGP